MGPEGKNRFSVFVTVGKNPQRRALMTAAAADALCSSHPLDEAITAELEHAVLADPLSVKSWIALCRHYSALASKERANSATTRPRLVRSFNLVNEAFERALTQNSYSYKLWTMYITTRTVQTEYLAKEEGPLFDPFPSLHALHLRAIEMLPMMPVLRRMHVDLCMQYERYETAASYTFKHLKALPLTQHPIIWAVIRKWTPVAPRLQFEAARKLWQTMLGVDTSLTARMEYLAFLVDRAQFKELLAFSCSLEEKSSTAAGTSLDGNPRPGKRTRAGDELLREPELWSIVAQVLGKASLHNGEESMIKGEMTTNEAVERLVEAGCLASPENKTSLIHGLSVFLCHRSQFAAARKHLRTLLSSAADADEYQSAFRVNLGFEQCVAEHVCLTTGSLSPDDLRAVYDTIYPQKSPSATVAAMAPTSELKKLVHNHGLELNAVQILSSPHVVGLWLKRVELLRERATVFEGQGGDEYRSTLIKDIGDVFEQAIGYACSRSSIARQEVAREGAEDTDARASAAENGRRHRKKEHQKKKLLSETFISAVEIFTSFGLFLHREARDSDRAISILKKGALFTPFPKIEDNTTVLGLLFEVMFIADKRQLASFIQSYFIDESNAKSSAMIPNAAPNQTGGRGGRRLSFFVESRSHGDVAELWKSPAAWQLAADWSHHLGQIELTRTVYAAMMSAGCYTAETAVVRSRRLYAAGRYNEAFAALEDAAQLFASNASSALVVLTIYLALFVSCPAVDPQQRIERVREIMCGLLNAASDDEVAQVATRDAANAFLKCAEIEALFGLYANSVSILRRGVDVITARATGTAREQYCSTLLAALLTTVLVHEGIQRSRKEFDALLQRGLPTTRLVGEVAVRYAAMESQAKCYDRARKIFTACSAKQHPSTPSGEAFWSTWERFEAAHGDVETFEEAQRLKRNVVARFSKQQVVFNTTTTTEARQGQDVPAGGGK